MSGKEQPLLAAPPLRTIRASFPAYGSSLFKSNYMSDQQLPQWNWD